MSKHIRPMLAQDRAAKLDLDDDWVLEIKYDGFRCILRTDLDGDRPRKVRLFTRRGKENSASFPEITDMDIEADAVLDGELIAWSPENQDSKLAYMQARNNVTNPQKLAVVKKRFPVTFMAFDILQLSNTNVRNVSLLERKQLLKEFGKRNPDLLVIDSYEANQYDTIWRFVKENRLEGLVAKRKQGKYVEGVRSHGWRKMKW